MKKNDPKYLLPKFVETVNEVADRFLPKSEAVDRRVKNTFTPRTVRAYQNKGIIDAPLRDGKRALYTYRHFLQAILVRRLLAEGLRAPKIRRMLADQSEEHYLELLSNEAPIEAQQPGMQQEGRSGKPGRGPWARLEITPGLEINVASGFNAPDSPEERQELFRSISKALRQEMSLRQHGHAARD